MTSDPVAANQFVAQGTLVTALAAMEVTQKVKGWEWVWLG